MTLNSVGSATRSRGFAASVLVTSAPAPSIAPVAGNHDVQQVALKIQNLFKKATAVGEKAALEYVGARTCLANRLLRRNM